MLETGIYSTLIWFSAILTGSLGVVIFFGSQNISSKAFANGVFWLTLWIISVGLFVSVRNYDFGIFVARLTYFFGSVVASSFLYFFLIYPEDKKPSKLYAIFLIILELILGYIFLFTDQMIPRISYTGMTHPWNWEFGKLSILFELIFFGFFGYGLTVLYKKINANSKSEIKSDLKLMLFATILGTIPASITGIILPRFNIFYLNWFGPVSEIIWIPVITYSILKYRQMNIKAAVTEVLAIAMAAIFFINIFIDTPFGIWARIATFLIFIVLSYFLIKGVIREATQREELKQLNQGLADIVASQTVEIRKSYEAEKHARLELEKLNDAKDQFITITQHHLRTPVISINWALESALKGTYGTIKNDLKNLLEDTLNSGKRLMQIINDFLSITAIKVGANILNKSEANLKPLLEDIFYELKSEIKSLNLKIEYPENDSDWLNLNLDIGKIRESLLIVIENAVRYNNMNGKISITTKNKDGLFKIMVENTGIGISSEESSKIGSALFYRGEFARKKYPIGMGVGLSVVKAIIKAHKGSFLIESEGSEKGAKVTITLPIA